jgi:hypothetical protein
MDAQQTMRSSLAIASSPMRTATLLPVLAFLVLAAPARAVTTYTPPTFACQTANTTNLPFCNPKLPIAARITDLLSRLTTAEKIGLMGSTPGACAAKFTFRTARAGRGGFFSYTAPRGRAGACY